MSIASVANQIIDRLILILRISHDSVAVWVFANVLITLNREYLVITTKVDHVRRHEYSFVLICSGLSQIKPVMNHNQDDQFFIFCFRGFAVSR